MRVVGIALLLVLLLLLPVGAQTPTVTLIIPGRQLGPLWMGMTQAQAVRAVGQAPDTGSNRSAPVWNIGWESLGLFAVFSAGEGGTVVRATTTSPAFRTSKGARVGLTKKEFVRRMGRPLDSVYSGVDGLLMYKGLQAEDAGGVIRAILVDRI